MATSMMTTLALSLALPAVQMSDPTPPQSAFVAADFPAQVLAYRPAHRPGVTDARYATAINILNETRTSTGGDPTKLNAADYWNITSAFAMLNEPAEAIRIAFQAAASDDAPAICSYIAAMGAQSLQKTIPETILPFEADCARTRTLTPAFDADAYAARHGYDVGLVREILAIQRDDQRYRAANPVDWSLQRPLDLKNQTAVARLLQDRGGYIGRDLVGSDLESTLWAVVQHSDLEMMERFLPIIHKAVTDRQLGQTPLKMLIDRVQAIKTGAQIFGSQAGVPLAAPDVQKAVMEQYGLD